MMDGDQVEKLGIQLWKTNSPRPTNNRYLIYTSEKFHQKQGSLNVMKKCLDVDAGLF